MRKILDKIKGFILHLVGNDVSQAKNTQDVVLPKHRSLDELLDISRRIHELKDDDKKEEEVVKASEGTHCGSCNRDNVDLVTCSKCSKLICPECVTETFDGESLCPECYDDMPALKV